MKGFVKCIIAGAVILGIGIAVLIIALAVNGWKFAPNVEFETQEFTSTEENTSLAVTLSAGKLKIEYRDDDSEEIYVSYPTAEGYETTVTEKDGKLSVENDYRIIGNVFSGCNVSCNVWGWGLNIPETVVKIPKDKITQVTVTLHAGTVELKEGTFEKVELDVHAGACAVGNITCKLLTIDVNAGSLSLDGVKAEKLICDVSSGSANMKKIDCPETEVEVSSGSANLTFVGAKTDYTATVQVSAGSCNGLSSQSGGDKVIKVKVSTGSFNASFLG